MTINNAVLKNCLKLSSKITVYVPATNGIDKAADNTEQVKKTAALLSELFGGATSTPALGYWMSPAAGLVAEATTVVFAYAADAALQEHVGRAELNRRGRAKSPSFFILRLANLPFFL